MEILVVAYYDLKALLKDRWGALPLLVPALLVLLLAGWLAPLVEQNRFVEPFAVAVVDQDRSYETRMLIHHLTSLPALADLVEFRQTGMAEAEAMLQADEVASVLVIPEGFASEMLQGNNLSPMVISNPARPLQSGLVMQLAQSGADLVTAAQSGVVTVLHYVDQAGISDREYDDWYNRTVLEFSLTALGRTQLLTTRLESATGPAPALQYYAIALGVVLLMTTGMAGLWNVRGEGAALYFRYRSLGVSAWQLALARFLVLVALQAMQAVVTLALVSPLLRTSWRGNALLAACVLLATLAGNAGLLLLISVAVPDRTAANLTALSLLVLLAVVGGSVLPPAYLPPAAQWLGNLSVSKWAVTGLLHAAFDPGATGVGTSIGVLAAMAVTTVGAAGWLLQRMGR